ncbi:hypothetical protein HDG34_004338 [Paraburkholderia sp. HC6.4b]|nr:hypothetical protein [Paraburkholderia sp. HC6.4b]MBB5452594.1 hypothetical protein [Paraburkholderia sp. Kb1A]
MVSWFIRAIRTFMRACSRSRRRARHHLQQHIAAGFQMIGARVLDFAVADAVLAGNEDHRAGCAARETGGVVARAADHVHRRHTEPLRALPDLGDPLRGESLRREVDDLLDVDSDGGVQAAARAGGGGVGGGVAPIAARLRARCTPCEVHRSERCVIGCAQVDAEFHAARNDVARV